MVSGFLAITRNCCTKRLTQFCVGSGDTPKDPRGQRLSFETGFAMNLQVGEFLHELTQNRYFESHLKFSSDPVNRVLIASHSLR